MQKFVIGALLAGSAIIAAPAAMAQGIPGIPGGGEAVAETAAADEEAATPVAAPPLSKEDAIIVRGLRERMSSWKRLETDEVILYSNGSASDLRKVALKIERLDALLRQLFPAHDSNFEHAPLEVTLIGGRGFVDRMRLSTPNIQQSGFGEPFANERLYSPSQYRTLLAAGRRDQVIDTQSLDEFLDTFGEDEDPDGFGGSGFGSGFDDPFGSSSGFDDGGFNDDALGSPVSAGGGTLLGQRGFSSPRQIMQPRDTYRRKAEDYEVKRQWESVLYGYYTEHFLLSNFATSYPRWYVDGLVAMFSTFDLRRDGRAEYWRLPEGFFKVMRSYPALKSEPILTGAHLLDPSQSTWSPYHAWLLTHFFLVGNPDGPRREQFLQYMAAVSRGVSLVEASAVFGDFAALDKELSKYRQGKIMYSVATINEPEPDLYLEHADLNVSDAETLQSMVLLEARVEVPPTDQEGGPNLVALKERYLAELRELAANNPANLDTARLLAEAECRAGNPGRCIAVADRILAEQASDPEALSWRAIALLQQAGKGDAAKAKEARAAIIAANRADPENILPLVSFSQVHELRAEQMPEAAMLGLIKVIAITPAAPGPRLILGREFVRRGNMPEAQEILLPVLNADQNSAEYREARLLLGQTGAS